MRVCAYSRISTDEKTQPYSLAVQIDKIKKYIEFQDNNWNLVSDYSDTITGAKMERPGLNKLFRDARSGKIDCVLVYKVDRLSRRMTHLCQIMDELDKCGVVFRSITEPFDTSTPAGRMMLNMLGVFAEFERKLISDRTSVGLQRKAELGEFCGGRFPFGYEKGDEGIKPLESEAGIVRKIFDLYVGTNMGASLISQTLNQGGLRRRSGELWSNTQVLYILKNPVYKGVIKRNGVFSKGKHGPIVSEEIWNKVQVILGKRRKNHSLRRSNNSPYLLSGLIKCGNCGYSLSGYSSRNPNAAKNSYYHCSGKQRYKNCNLSSIPKGPLEAAILSQLKGILRSSTLVAMIIQRATDRFKANNSNYVGELANLKKEITEKEDSICRYLKAFEKGTMPEDVCGKRLKELGTELEQLKVREVKLENLRENQVEPSAYKDVKEIFENAEDILVHAPNSHKKAIIKKLVKKVIVHSRDYIEAFLILPRACIIGDSGPQTHQYRKLWSRFSGWNLYGMIDIVHHK